MFYAALLLKTSQIPVFFDVGLKNTINYGVFGHLTFNNLAICSGFCLPGHKNLVKNSIFVRFCSCFVVVVVVVLLLLLLVLALVLVLVLVVVVVVVVVLVLVLVLVVAAALA